MSVFIIQNQHQQFLNKNKEWVHSSESQGFFFTIHHDIALNQLIEINAKDFSLRGTVEACNLNSRGQPELPVSTQYSKPSDDNIPRWVEESIEKKQYA
jgi:hypothetical protein